VHKNAEYTKKGITVDRPEFRNLRNLVSHENSIETVHDDLNLLTKKPKVKQMNY
jgi:hypothetical protein